MSNVTIIPARKKILSNSPAPITEKRKVAGYARVSTDHEEQQTSYDAQVDYYTNYINAHEDWVFAGIYTDDGISATNTKRRHGFNQMVSDALDGKIDLIITKSVSRFARNTVDSLTTVRKLKEKGIEIFFEKENIWTLDTKGELLITIMSSIAQEESRNISENVKWGHRKRFADGRGSLCYSQFLGYDKGPDGKMVVNKEEAKVVIAIYKWFLEGMSYKQIADKLTAKKIPTPAKKTIWRQGVVKSILQNEKYKGDALLQKSYTVDFLTKETKRNEGEIPMYYVENDHEAIIDRDTFDEVQDEIMRRDVRKNEYSNVNPFSSKLVCGDCGGWYGHKVWHSNDEKRRKDVFRCNSVCAGRTKCKTPAVTEKEISEGFIRAVNGLIENRDEIVENTRVMMTIVDTTKKLRSEQEEALQEMEVVAGLIEKCVKNNAQVAQDQDAYEKKYDGLVKRYEKASMKHDKCAAEIDEVQRKLRAMKRFIKDFEKQEGVIEKFDETLWRTLLKHVVIYTKEDIRFVFRNGQEVQML